MKMKKLKINNLNWILALVIIVFAFSSCSDDDQGNGSGNPPIIESVSPTLNSDGQVIPLEPTVVGFANNTYLIQGSGFSSLEKVFFNDFDTSFNPNFVTDNSIFVVIDRDTPYENVTNKLKLVTKFGTTEFDFTVAPPAPELTSFNPINATQGDVITLYGSFFLDPVVTIGDVEAEIVTSSFNQIQVVVPANSQYEYVTVSTISGESTASQAIGTAIYDDTAAPFVENYMGPWDGSGFVTNSNIKIQGESSIEANYSGYTGFKIPMYASPVPTAPYKGIRVSFRSTKETGKFKVVINNNYGAGLEVSFEGSKWTTFEILFSELGGTPATIEEIVFQEFNNDGGDKLYIDDVGFLLND